MSNLSPQLTVLIPALNEEGNIARLCDRLNIALEQIKKSAEVIVVNDGSTDQTLAKLQVAASIYPFLRVLNHASRKGATEALSTGFAAAKGDVIILLPADMESDPVEDIPLLLSKLAEGFDVVTGRRINRNDKKEFASKIANATVRAFYGVSVHDMNWIKAFKRETIEGLRLRSEWHRYLVPIWAKHGYKIAEVTTNWYPRVYGESKFGFQRLYTSLVDFCVLSLLLVFAKQKVIKPKNES